jgi:hypothetical protein
MNTKQIIAALSVAAALAVITPASAGGLVGGLGGGFGGGLAGGLSGMPGMNRFGGVSGQGALQGQGAVNGSLERPKLQPAAGAAKADAAKAANVAKEGSNEGLVWGGAAAQAAGNFSKTGNAGAATLAGSAESAAAVSKSTPSTPTPSTATPSAPAAQMPASSASLAGAGGLNAGTRNGAVGANGMGAVDAQHSSSGTSFDASGAGSASASRNPQ